MTRHFGLSSMTARSITGAGQPTARHHAPPIEARCNLSSFAADPSFPRSNFVQAVLDALAVLFLVLLASAFGVAIALAVFVLLFVGT